MKNLGRKPFVLVNIDGYYDGFIQQMERAKEDDMLYLEIAQFFYVVTNVDEALTWCVSRARGEISNGNITTPVDDDDVTAVDFSKLPQISHEQGSRGNNKATAGKNTTVTTSTTAADGNYATLLASAAAIFAVGVFVGYALKRS